jgi:hypothetical protein
MALPSSFQHEMPEGTVTFDDMWKQNVASGDYKWSIDPYITGEGIDRQTLGFFGVDANAPFDWLDFVEGEYAIQNSVIENGPAAPREVDPVSGMPLDWNWETAITGPWGEVLPETAQGWLVEEIHIQSI